MPSEDSSRRLRRNESVRSGIQSVQIGKNVGDSVRAVCGDKPHVQFGRGGLVLLSNQDLAFYLTSQELRPARKVGKASRRAKGDRKRIPRGKVRGTRMAVSERESLIRRAGYRETGPSGSGRDGWKRTERHLASRLTRVTCGRAQRIKYARLIRRKASSERAKGADCQGSHYVVQLALE